MGKPVIASVHGPCAGGGFSLAMACDLVIAADNAMFTLAYSMIAASPDGSSTYFLPRLVGRHKALELIYLSDRFGSDKAADLGLVNFVVPEAELAAETEKLAARLAAGPTLAYAKAKTLVNRSLASGIADQLDAESQNIANSSLTASPHSPCRWNLNCVPISLGLGGRKANRCPSRYSGGHGWPW